MRRPQEGTTAVEMALVLPILTLALLGTVDLARWAQAAQALDEAARAGARLAAVCDPGDAAVGERVQQRLRPMWGAASPPTVTLAYEPMGCGAETCTRVRVTLSGAVLAPQAPWWPVALTLPPASVEIPRESLRSTLDGRSNPSCL